MLTIGRYMQGLTLGDRRQHGQEQPLLIGDDMGRDSLFAIGDGMGTLGRGTLSFVLMERRVIQRKPRRYR